jgi:hypothetical protein
MALFEDLLLKILNTELLLMALLCCLLLKALGGGQLLALYRELMHGVHDHLW